MKPTPEQNIKCTQRIKKGLLVGSYTYLCGRDAQFKDDKGNPLCHKHYNSFVKRNNKISK